MLWYLELNHLGLKYCSYFAVFTMVCQFLMMIALRSHYTVDMLSAIIFAHYFWIMSEKYAWIIDEKVFGMKKVEAVNEI